MKAFARGCAVAAAVVCAATATAQQAPARLYFRESGFSIAALEATDETGPYQVLIMMLPATESFAPSVNVQIQPFDGTMEEYASVSREQFAAASMSVVGERTDGNAVTFEYVGDYSGRKIHWYATASAGDGKVYLVTATALETQWEAASADLRKCVDSFRRER